MKKVSLVEAQEIINNIQLTDAFASIINESETEDVKRVQFYKELLLKIYHAEKSSEILDIRIQIDLLDIESEYFHPDNNTFYYKDNISKEDISEIKLNYNLINLYIKKLNDRIKEKEEQTFIEI